MSQFAPRNPDYDADLRRRFLDSPVCRFFGFEVEEVLPGSVTLALPCKPEFGHRPGYFQGTIIGAIADYAGSFACYTLIPADWQRLTLDYTLKFLNPAHGERLTACGRVLSQARTISVAAVDMFVLRDAATHLCATALVTTRHTAPRE
jgi:uncharacterized protein (TIGR00369 family)